MFDLTWVLSSVIIGLVCYKSSHNIGFLLFSIVVGTTELLVAYPWIFSTEITFILRTPLHVWIILVGVGMIRYRSNQPEGDLKSIST